MSAKSQKIRDDWWLDEPELKGIRITGRTRSAGWRWKISCGGWLWLWLNVEGNGLVWGDTERFVLKPGIFALTGGDGADGWTCVRYPGNHLVEIVLLSREWLADRLGGSKRHPALAEWLESGARTRFCGLMGDAERELAAALAASPRPAFARKEVTAWAGLRKLPAPPTLRESPQQSLALQR